MPTDPPDDRKPPAKGPSGTAQRRGTNGAAPTPPRPTSSAAGEATAAALEPAPEAIADLAAACEKFVFARYGVRLDRTPETLSILDQYVRDARPEIEDKPETLPLVQAAIGAYLGEVVRHAYPARWYAEGDHDAWRLDLVHVFLTFNPIGMAREALTLNDEEGWHAHVEVDDAERELVERRLLSLPEVPDDEFYAPTTRFEVLEIVIDALRAQMLERGLGEVTFGPEDYRHK